MKKYVFGLGIGNRELYSFIIINSHVSEKQLNPHAIYLYQEKECFERWKGDANLCEIVYPLESSTNLDGLLDQDAHKECEKVGVGGVCQICDLT